MYTRELIGGMAVQDLAGIELVVGAPHPGFFADLEGIEGLRVLPLPLTRDDPWGRMLANHTVVPQLARRIGAQVVLRSELRRSALGRLRDGGDGP